MKKTISINILFNYFGIFGQIIIAFFLTPFLVNTLGDTKYGIWSIATAFTGYMSLLDLGLSSAVNRYVSKYMGKKDIDSINAIASSALLLFVMMSLIIFMVSPFMASLITNFINIDEKHLELVYVLIIVVSFDVGIFVVGNLFRGLFGGLQRYDVINVVQIISAVYKAVMFYLYLSSGYDLVAMGYISLSGNLISIIIFYLTLKYQFPHIHIRLKFAQKGKAYQILNFSKFTFLAMLANQVIYYSDSFVIGYFLSAAAITYYSIPWSLSEYTKKMCQAISRTYAPAFSELESMDDMEGVRKLFISGTRFMIIISNLLSIGVMVFGGILISIWIGPEYKEACETVLVILFINQFIMGPQMLSYSLLQGLSKQKTYSYLYMIVSIINLILSIILVQIWGIVGVAIGAMLPQVIFHGFFVPLYTLKILKLSLKEYFTETYMKSILPSLVLAVSLLLFVQYSAPYNYITLIGYASLSAIFYFIVVYMFMLNTDEKIKVNNYLKKFRV